MSDEPEAGEVVCDTTFVSVMQSAHLPKNREVIDSWPDEVRNRLDNAVLGISVISLAELRAGHAYAGWGPERIADAEARIAAYLWFPLDMDVVEKCAELLATNKRNGWNVDDNDLWIAATAQSRGVPVVSCDLDFCRIEGIELIYLPARADAPSECPDSG